MAMRPDYGMYLRDQGITPQVEHVFYDFRTDHVSIVGPSQYTTMVNIVREGREFAMSLDFDETRMRSILTMMPAAAAARIRSELGSDRTIRTIEFGQPVSIGIKARLGALQRVEREQFVPFILEDIFATTEAGAASGQRLVAGGETSQLVDPSKKFYHFPTAEAREAITAGSGELYQTIIRCVAEHNPELRSSPKALALAVARLVGPQFVEDVFEEPKPIGKLPTHVRLRDRVVPILETDPTRYTKLTVLNFAVRQGILKEFGDLRAYQMDRDSAREEGVNPDDIDRMVVSVYYRGLIDGRAEIESGSIETEGLPQRIRNRVRSWFGLD